MENKVILLNSPSSLPPNSNTDKSQDISFIMQILDMSRWAPSADNVQPWRFEIIDDEHIIVHLLLGCHDDLYEVMSDTILGRMRGA